MDVCLTPGGKTSFAMASPPNAILAGTLDGVRVVSRPAAGAPWTVGRYGLDGAHVGSLLSIPGGTLFAGAHSGGLFRKDGSGAPWTRVTRGIAAEHEHIYTLAAQQRGDRVVLWAGTQPAALYRSDDLGATWVEYPGIIDVPDTDTWSFPAPPHIAHVKHISFHPAEPDTMFVCIEQGALLKSVDGGHTWVELSEYSRPEDPSYKDIHRLVIPPSAPDKLFFTSGEGLYSSADAGKTWIHTTRKRDRLGYPDQLFLDPRDERTIFIAGAANSPPNWRATKDGRPGVLRSRDDGATWVELNNGLPEKIRGNIEAMTMCYGPYGVHFFAGTATGDIFLSEDAGESWSTIAAGLPPISKGGHYRAFVPA